MLLQKRAEMEVTDLPDLDELLFADHTKPFPYTKTLAEAAQDLLCVLYTSGSTGLPKPISWSHALIGTMDAVRLLPPTKGDHSLRPWIDSWNEQADFFKGIFHTLPSEQSINLKDLYQQHPTKPYLWSYKGRNDDIIALSNGYKIYPLDTEAFITTHPAIEGFLMIGSGKAQASLSIELRDAALTGKSDELLDSICGTVKKANSMSIHKT